jgi:hypothetical protein
VRENTGTAVGIALLATFGYAIWASVVAVVTWLSLTIYAIVKWIGAPADHASPRTVLLLIVGNVTLFLLLMTTGMYLAGRSMRYKKRRRETDSTDLVPAD